jgi:TonB-dependent starch-binding outer membrane protein SusC
MKTTIQQCTKALSLAVFLLLSVAAMAQQQISGVLTDEAGEPIIGASVIEKGTTNGAVTDIDGKFDVKVAKATSTLVISFVGFQTQEVVVGSQTTLNLKMAVEESTLGQVVVIGYGTQRKKDLTGSVASLNSDKFQKGNIVAPEQLLLGKVAGVQVSAAGGQPGAGARIRIRGTGSINGGKGPLIVVDGFPIAEGVGGLANPLSTINPNDIENMTILKDASATAIYGSRASGGVILITTKKGAAGVPKFNFSTAVTYGAKFKGYDVLDANQFREIVKKNGNADQIGLLDSTGAGTDWQDLIYQNTVSTDNNLSVSGSFKSLPYRVSVGYTDQKGMLLQSRFKRTTVAVNLAPKFLNDDLKFNLSYKYARANSFFANEGAIGGAATFDPTKPVRSGNTRFGGYYEWLDKNEGTPQTLAGRNPLAQLNDREDQGFANRHLMTGSVDYKLPFLKGLRVNLNLGLDLMDSEGNVKVDSSSSLNYRQLMRGDLTNYNQENTNKLLETYIAYAAENTNHRFDIMAGYAYQDNIKPTFSITKSQEGDTLGSKILLNKKTQYTLLSFFGRTNYTLKDRYYATFTYRADGSSKLSAEKRWTYTPAVALAWAISREPFMEKNKVFSNLKLRLGWGVTAQQDIDESIGNYAHLARFTQSDNTAQYRFGDTYYNTLRPNGYNSLLGWETTTTSNIALDFLNKNERFGGSIEGYNRLTEGVLIVSPVAAGANLTDRLIGNVGSMRNQGVELTLNVTPIKKKDLELNLSYNITYNKNEILSLSLVKDTASIGIPQGGIGGGVGNNIQINTVGFPINSFYVQKQVYEGGKPVGGKYEDLNGDGIINQKDFRQFKKPDPDYFMGFSGDVRFKGLSLGFSMRANLGNYVYNNIRSNNSVFVEGSLPFLNNIAYDANSAQFKTKELFSDYYLEDASFLRMDNINLGYNLSSLFNNKINLQASFNVNNVFVVSKYLGLDPEVDSGIDNGVYPRQRAFSLGLNFTY